MSELLCGKWFVLEDQRLTGENFKAGRGATSWLPGPAVNGDSVYRLSRYPSGRNYFLKIRILTAGPDLVFA
jgi:hypothetical protein